MCIFNTYSRMELIEATSGVTLIKHYEQERNNA